MFALQPDPSFLQQFHRVDSVIFHLEAVANVRGEANLGEKNKKVKRLFQNVLLEEFLLLTSTVMLFLFISSRR